MVIKIKSSEFAPQLLLKKRNLGTVTFRTLFSWGKMTECNNTESEIFYNAHGFISASKSKPQKISQEVKDEQDDNYIPLSTKQVKDLTRLIWGINKSHPMDLISSLRVPAVDLPQPIRQPT